MKEWTERSEDQGEEEEEEEDETKRNERGEWMRSRMEWKARRNRKRRGQKDSHPNRI